MARADAALLLAPTADSIQGVDLVTAVARCLLVTLVPTRLPCRCYAVFAARVTDMGFVAMSKRPAEYLTEYALSYT